MDIGKGLILDFMGFAKGMRSQHLHNNNNQSQWNQVAARIYLIIENKSFINNNIFKIIVVTTQPKSWSLGWDGNNNN